MKQLLVILFVVCLISSSHYTKEKEDYNNSILLEQSNFNFMYPTNVNVLFPSFMFPIKDQYRISSEFGVRRQIIKGMGGEEGDFHRGIDIVSKPGSEIIASASGLVHLHYPAPSRYYKGHPVFGGMIVLNHGNGIFTLYGHLSKSFVREGQFVEQGQTIGIIGNTGISTGTHLHFEVLFNPTEFFF